MAHNEGQTTTTHQHPKALTLPTPCNGFAGDAKSVLILTNGYLSWTKCNIGRKHSSPRTRTDPFRRHLRRDTTPQDTEAALRNGSTVVEFLDWSLYIRESFVSYDVQVQCVFPRNFTYSILGPSHFRVSQRRNQQF